MNGVEAAFWRGVARAYRVWAATWRIDIVMPDGSTRREYEFDRELFAMRERDVLAASAFGRASRCVAMIAEGKDGDRAAEVARTLGVDVVRGSARHHPLAGALSFTRALRASVRPAVLVVDGPLGPIGVAKEGVSAMAAHAGRTIVPVAFDARPKITLAYLWSRMIVPLPFARIRAVIAAPIAPGETRPRARAALARDVTAAIASCATAARAFR